MCDPTTWVQVDATALPPDVRQSFQSRKLAVELYLGGTDDSEIRRLTGVGEKQAYRLIRHRCMAPAPDGLLFGWRGLIRHLRVRKPARKSKIRIDDFGYGAVGALQATFEAHPDLKLELERRILQVGTNGAKLGAHNRSNVSHTRWFLDKLRKLGYEERGEWPFNTQTLSYSSISRFVKSTLESSARAMAFARGGAEAVKKLKTGDGARRPELAFMSRVEMDAHKLDGFFCVSLPSPDGDVRERIVRRLQVVVLIEVASRTVLGYHLSMGREPSKDDVLRAIKHVITKWEPRKLRFSEEGYVKGAGFRVTRTQAQACGAVSEMGVGLPKSACRSWFQTARCGCVQKAWS